MGNCKIVNCSTKKGERSAFQVPFEPVLRAQWIKQISRHQEFNYYTTSYHLCELHFDPNKLLRQGKRCMLKKGTIPTIFPTANGTNVVYKPPVEPLKVFKMHSKRHKTVKIEPNVKIEPEIKIEPEFIDVGPSSCGMDTDYQPLVVVKTEPLEHTDSNEPEATSSSTNLNCQKPTITKSNAPCATSTTKEPNERWPTISISALEYRRLLHQEIQLIKYKELCQKKTDEIKRLNQQLKYHKSGAAKHKHS